MSNKLYTHIWKNPEGKFEAQPEVSENIFAAQRTLFDNASYYMFDGGCKYYGTYCDDNGKIILLNLMKSIIN